MKKETGGPAFPLPAEQVIHTESQGIIGTEGYGRHAEYGMSLRDYFAAKAMQAMLTRDCPVCTSGMAKDAYIYADAMLSARSA